MKKMIWLCVLLWELCSAMTVFGAESDAEPIASEEEGATEENRDVRADISLTGPPVWKEIWYIAHESEDGDDGSYDQTGKMEHDAEAEKSGNGFCYVAEIPKQYDQIEFLLYDPDEGEDTDHAGDTTDLLNIPNDLKHPCFYLDADDPSEYDNVPREGYWDEASEIRDPEKEYDLKGRSSEQNEKGLVSVPSGRMPADQDTMYLDTELYDYYTDLELGGYPRGSHGTAEKSQRSWVPFRNLDEALSDEYRKNGGIPLYVGHFQPDVLEECRFRDVAPLLNLTGWDNVNGFFSTNNSTMNVLGEGNAENSKYDYAAQGLIGESLEKGYPVCKSLNGRYDLNAGLPLFSRNFLEGKNSRKTKLGKVYEHAAFPFRQVDRDGDGILYWSFDSAKDHVHLMKNETAEQDGFAWYFDDLPASENTEDPYDWSKNVTSAGVAEEDKVSDIYGFFPLNNPASHTDGNAYNFGFGMRLAFDFYLPEHRVLQDKEGKNKPVIFTFSGDDDLWVFLDGKLVLDVGGDHGKVTGTINFTDETSFVSRVKKSQGDPDVTEGPQTTSFHLEGDENQKHTLVLFYMERGMWESNLKLQFNMAPERMEQTEPSTLPFTGEEGISRPGLVIGFGLLAASLLIWNEKKGKKKKTEKKLLLLALLLAGAAAVVQPVMKARAEELQGGITCETSGNFEQTKDRESQTEKAEKQVKKKGDRKGTEKEREKETAGDGWEEPLEGTATLIIRNFPAGTDFYAAGISDRVLEKYGIHSGSEDVSAGKLAEAASEIDQAMTVREKELIHADGLTFRGLAFDRTYLITGHSVQTEEGIVQPVPFLFRAVREQKETEAEVKYTVKKAPTPTPQMKKQNPKKSKDSTGTGKTPRQVPRQNDGTSLELKKKDGRISLEPVRTGDVNLKEIGITILSAFILGLAVIIRKRIK